MKHRHPFAIGLLALTLAACGGGGGGHKSNSTPNTGTPRVEVVFTDANANSGYRFVDPENLESGDQVRFELVTYTNGVRQAVPIGEVAWRSTDSNAAAQISPESGAYVAPSSTTSVDREFIATGRYQEQDYSINYRVNPRQVRVLGRLLAEGTLQPIDGAVIQVFGRSNAQDSTSAIVPLASGKTASDGTFRVSVRATNDVLEEGQTASPLYFTIQTSSIPKNGFYDSFVFRGGRYDTGNDACFAPLVVPNEATPSTTDTKAPTTGDRLLIESNDPEAFTNGTVLLTPISTSPNTRPDADSCIDPDAANG